jgi:hypothetical protein
MELGAVGLRSNYKLRLDVQPLGVAILGNWARFL